MGKHTFDPTGADRLDDPARRFRYLSAEELLGPLSLAGTEDVLDLGSGTGFYTDLVAERAGRVFALDLQPEMHARYVAKGLPSNVAPLTASADAIPLWTDAVDRVVSTMTYHEVTGDGALRDLARVVRSGGRVVVADWRAGGEGAAGPPVAERFDVDHAVEGLRDAGFDVERASSRPETFLVVAIRR